LPKEVSREKIEIEGENNTEKEDTILPYFGHPKDLKETPLKELFLQCLVDARSILFNPSFIFNALAGSSKLFTMSAFIVFLPKFVAISFGKAPLFSSLLVGVTAVPGFILSPFYLKLHCINFCLSNLGAALGMLFAGFVIKHFNANVKQTMNFCIGAAIAPVALTSLFLVPSPAPFFIMLVLSQFSSFAEDAPLPTILMRYFTPFFFGSLSVSSFNLFSAR